MIKIVGFVVIFTYCLFISVCVCEDDDSSVKVSKSVPINSSQSNDGEKCQGFIEKLFLVSSDRSDESSILSKIPSDYNYYIDRDLNEGAGGKHIYLAYSYQCGLNFPITMLDVKTDQTCQAQWPWEFVPNSDGSSCPGLDLNEDAGGHYVYLYSSAAKSFSNQCTSSNKFGANRICCDTRTNPSCDSSPITDIKIISSYRNEPSYPGYFVHPQDLNQGTKGPHVWIAWK